MPAYYNENDPKAAAWLRELIAAGCIAPGEVDERDVEEVESGDLRGFEQHHFFAGIGGWSLALRLAGWPDDEPVWTGSCPCQPFSAAGSRKGIADERHLWPAWYALVRECRPRVLFGEQVASKDGLRWADAVSADLEAAGYAVGIADLCAAGIGAPHIRSRLWWVADTDATGCREQRSSGILDGEREACGHDADGRGAVCRMADSERSEWRAETERRADDQREVPCGPEGAGRARECCPDRRMGYSDGARRGRDAGSVPRAQAQGGGEREGSRGVADQLELAGDGFWRDFEFVPCADGKVRPIAPGIEPCVAALAHGVSAGVVDVCASRETGAAEEVRRDRIAEVRGYGNAIVAPLAAEFIRAYVESAPGRVALAEVFA